jgi:hypothetical protein
LGFWSGHVIVVSPAVLRSNRTSSDSAFNWLAGSLSFRSGGDDGPAVAKETISTKSAVTNGKPTSFFSFQQL